MIYLDNSATTRIDDDVLEAMLPWLREHYGNASSAYMMGRKARVAVEDAREEIASLMGAHPAEMFFTSGGTESNNTVLKSCLISSSLADRLAYSATEHHAVLHPAEELHIRGYATLLIGVDDDGTIRMEDLQLLNDKRTLVSVMHANNETGTVQSLRTIRDAIPDALLHTDAVQSLGKIPLNMQDTGVDFASMSAHKIHGPKGVGAMFVRKGIDFKAHQHGGGQERNRRAGTEPVALIAGFQVAARNAVQNITRNAQHTANLITLLRNELTAELADIRFNTPPVGALPTILNISFLDAPRLDGEAILQMMDMHGIAVSNGSACVSGSLQPSHVLLAMHRPSAEAKAAVRFSVSKFTTEQEIRSAVAALTGIVTTMRG